jgi:uncharacterized membrane protein
VTDRVDGSRPTSRAGTGMLLGGILLLAACLRFALLGQHSLWSDEIFVVWITRFAWRDLLHVVAAVDFHPPLYYLLMKAWVGVAGTGETVLRIPSAVASVLTVGLTYALMRKVAPVQVSLLGAFLVSVSPFHIMAAQEARMYPLVGALVVASTWAIADAVEQGSVLGWIVYASLALLIAYTSYLAVLVLVAHGAWIVGWNRRHLRGWLAALVGVGCLYALWVPSLWTQVGQAHGLSETTLRLGDLFGLFAYGGALFGAAGYFSAGRLGPLEQVILLVPFLVTLGFGVVSFGANRRGLALLGLPPVMTIGVMAVLSLVNPIFIPRWFSIVLPFWAMFLACGIVWLASTVRFHPRAVAAWWTVGLLLYSLPALHQYYLDPATWSFRWRAAAALVARLGGPDDLLLFVDLPGEETFRYYFRERRPSLILAPRGGPEIDARALAQARGLAGTHHRVWLVVNGPVSAQLRGRVLPALSSAFGTSVFYDFTGAELYRFEGHRASGP